MSCRNEPAGPDRETIIRVKTVEIVSETISIPIHSSGFLATSEEMKLSFKAGGIVARINASEGDRVKKDIVLAELNLSEIKANVNIAANGYEKALRDWTRAKNLYADTVATLEQFQNASTALDVARSNLEIARFNLRHSVIKAHADGIILKQLVKENEMVSAGFPVFLFGVSGESWKVRSGLSDRDIVRINPGDSAVITIDAYPGIKFPAEVEQISGMSNPMTGTYEIELTLNGSGYRLAAGFIAAVDIFPAKKTTVMKVPVGAIVDADGEAGYIYAVDSPDRVAKIRVDIISISGSNAAISGISGEIKEIVSEGAAYLKDGMKVEVVR
jgi:multidrug efflux system membrane fusion protein